jgi:hypothetical protein
MRAATSINIHGTVRVEVKDANRHDAGEGRGVFYTRDIIVWTGDTDRTTITVFGDHPGAVEIR